MTVAKHDPAAARDGFDVAGRPDRGRYPARNVLPAYPAASHTRFGVPLYVSRPVTSLPPAPLHAAPVPSNACLHARESPSPASAEHKRGARGGRPRRNSSTPPASLEHAMTDTISADYSLRPSELASTLALLVEARQPVVVWGGPRVRQESDRPAGRGASRPRVCRCPRPAVGPGRPAWHPVA